MTYSALRPRARVYRVYMLVPWAVLPALSCYLPVVLGFSAHVGSVGSRCARRATGDRFQHDRARVVCIRGGSGDSASIGTEQHHTEKSPIRYVDIFKGYHGFRGSSAWPRRAVAIDGIDTGNSNTNKTRTINSIDGGVQLDGVNRGGAWGRAPEDDVSLGRMLRFILPTLGIWLASPILSLVDAGVVGTRSALELASLGPATVLCESLIYCSTFLAIATTNLQATALADGNKEEAQKVVAQALGLALAIGFVVATGVQLAGPRVLVRLAGEKSKEVVPAALVYSRVRILGAPSSIAAMVLQAACLGARDSVTPLGVVAVAGLVNAAGDWLTVCRLNMGVLGAAAATALAETVSMVLLAAAVWRAQGKRLHRFVSLPSMDELNVFLKFAGPIAIALFGKVICYSVMTLTCTTLGTIPLATHNVMLRIFFFFATFGEALSQTAQALLPGELAKDRSLATSPPLADDERSRNPRHSPARRVMRKVLILGVAVGSLNACVAGLVPLYLPHLFTNSADITNAMRGLAPLLSWSLLVHACVMGLEGILLARRRLGFLASCYAVNTVVMVGFMEFVKTWPLSKGLHGAWMGLLLLQMLRVVEFGIHLLWINRQDLVKATRASAAG